jgi:hypothetical protein
MCRPVLLSVIPAKAGIQIGISEQAGKCVDLTLGIDDC